MEKRVDANGTKIYRECEYKAPPVELFRSYESVGEPQCEIQSDGRLIEKVVACSLKKQAKLINAEHGPQATRYEVEVPQGTSFKELELIQANIMYELALVNSARVAPSNSGKRSVYIEIPNKSRSLVGLREIISSPAFVNHKSNLAFAVGKDICGEPIVSDLEQISHLLIAGESGSGKSTWLNGFILSLMRKAAPNNLKFVLIHSANTGLDVFYGMPHLLIEKPIVGPIAAFNALTFIDNEMDRRYNLLQSCECNSLLEYNSLPEVVGGTFGRLPHIVVIIDELEELMRSNMSREIEGKIYRITRLAKAAGIRMIAATHRASSDVLTGTIKANIFNRIAFRLPNAVDSRIALDMSGAESLIGRGDMLFYPLEARDPMRVQGPCVEREEARAAVDYLRRNYECDFDASAEEFVFNGGID